ncbi:efflux RND transporter periplasmic adaptor subunit [Nevskia ramosa]|uniref:efflux RND transporter periplasmic adaptor subunit n=1 Tax=Nevskia ramosa TaxID=64002 RepID=UPI0003B5717C|nr:efflux RND transporter periplasmic adaptor subunit [Nevskia ramosa]
MKTPFKLIIGTLVIATVAGLTAPRWMPLLHGAKKPTDVTVAGEAKKSGEGKAKGDGGGRAPQKVSTLLIKPEPFTETLSATGSLLADEGVELQAEINGKIAAIRFREGSKVSRGELLVKLNDSDLRAQRELAKHNLELAVLREQRVGQLVKEGIVTASDYDTAKYEVSARIDQISIIDAQIEKTEVRAPFDGVVGLRYVSEGSYVNATTRVATLQQIDRLKVNFSVPEKYAGRVKVGSAISFSIVGSDRRFKGSIYAFDPRIDAGTRTVVIRAVCENPGGALLPGAFANVELELAKLDDAILVPAEAVIPGVSEKNVFVLVDGKATRRPVEIGTRTANQVQILSGLAAGDRLIVSGLQQMREGLAVADAADNDGAAKEGPATAKVDKAKAGKTRS